MVERQAVSELTEFSDSGAQATEWSAGRAELAAAELYWLSTVRPGGRPHVAPLIGVWWQGALYFTTGSTERKAKNLEANPNCILTTGHNVISSGFDVAVEGQAVLVTEKAEFEGVADAFEAKYGEAFTAPDGTWSGLGDRIRAADGVLLYRVLPSKAFGWGKGEVFSETRWRF